MPSRFLLLVALSLLVSACASRPSTGDDAGATSPPPVAGSTAAAAPRGSASVFAGGSIDGRVLGGGTPIGKSTVTLWAATPDAPKQLAQTQTDAEGKFALTFASGDGIPYLVATGGATKDGAGDNPAIALLSVLGEQPPAHVTINEFTTVASVWTMNQFIDGKVVKGYPRLADRRRERAQFRRSRDRRMGRDDPGPAQLRPDADNGKLRDAR